MTDVTSKQRRLLDLLAREGRVESVYKLAQRLNRPYRRVFDNVKALHEAGLLKLIPSESGGRRQLAVEAVESKVSRSAQPELSYDRSWSAPVTGVDDNTLIASVLADPTFTDLLSCARHYGIGCIRKSYRRMLSHGDLRPWAAEESGRILGNLEIGFARAA